jgi:hypothetical protein
MRFGERPGTDGAFSIFRQWKLVSVLSVPDPSKQTIQSCKGGTPASSLRVGIWRPIEGYLLG